MSGHLTALPFLLPLATAIVMLLLPGDAMRRTLALASSVAGLAIAILLLHEAADGAVAVYRFGDWPAPFGIVFVADRLATTMLVITTLLATLALLDAARGDDAQGRSFHSVFQIQIAGLAGAFLTGDVFNLFVCFEVLLLASYILLVHGGGRARTTAALSYVIVNLVGSAVFLIALALTYGTLGTLTFADMPAAIARLDPEQQPLLRTLLAVMASVFLLKAAVFPLGLWIASVYSCAITAVAMLFAVMTKIGFYALLRSSSVVLEAPSLAGAASPWLHGLALLTIGFGALGVLAARRLSVLTAYLVVISTGTLIYAVATGGPAVIAAALYYLPHTTFATAGLFFVAGTIAARRGQLGDTLVCGELADMRLVGVLFAILAIAVSGLPPLSGFLGKVMLMRANPPGPDPAFWSALLISGFVMTVALARAASTLFWERREPADPTLAARPADPRFLLVAATLLLIPIALTVFARPIAEHMRATAQDLARPAAYVDAVMADSPVARETRR